MTFKNHANILSFSSKCKLKNSSATFTQQETLYNKEVTLKNCKKQKQITNYPKNKSCAFGLLYISFCLKMTPNSQKGFSGAVRQEEADMWVFRTAKSISNQLMLVPRGRSSSTAKLHGTLTNCRNVLLPPLVPPFQGPPPSFSPRSTHSFHRGKVAENFVDLQTKRERRGKGKTAEGIVPCLCFEFSLPSRN